MCNKKHGKMSRINQKLKLTREYETKRMSEFNVTARAASAVTGKINKNYSKCATAIKVVYWLCNQIRVWIREPLIEKSPTILIEKSIWSQHCVDDRNCKRILKENYERKKNLIPKRRQPILTEFNCNLATQMKRLHIHKHIFRTNTHEYNWI